MANELTTETTSTTTSGGAPSTAAPASGDGPAAVPLDGSRAIHVQGDRRAQRVYFALSHPRARTQPLPSLDPSEARALAAALTMAAERVERAVAETQGGGEVD